MSISWAESTLAEANIPAPARKSLKKPRLLLMLSPLQRTTDCKKASRGICWIRAFRHVHGGDHCLPRASDESVGSRYGEVRNVRNFWHFLRGRATTAVRDCRLVLQHS